MISLPLPSAVEVKTRPLLASVSIVAQLRLHTIMGTGVPAATQYNCNLAPIRTIVEEFIEVRICGLAAREVCGVVWSGGECMRCAEWCGVFDVCGVREVCGVVWRA